MLTTLSQPSSALSIIEISIDTRIQILGSTLDCYTDSNLAGSKKINIAKTSTTIETFVNTPRIIVLSKAILITLSS